MRVKIKKPNFSKVIFSRYIDTEKYRAVENFFFQRKRGLAVGLIADDFIFFSGGNMKILHAGLFRPNR